jgi:hypothetical protein
MPPRRVSLAFGIAAAVLCIAFAAATGHIWEDYFITFRSSLNLATGHGLVYQPGERVHSFTSPLGTLLPALFALGGGGDVAVRALWCFRVVSALALGGALWLAVRTMVRSGLGMTAVVGGCALCVLDAKIVDFAINGMESALLVFFIVVTWRALAAGPGFWPLAAGFAGLQWTRPDGVVFAVALTTAWMAFGGQKVAGGEPVRWRTLIRAAALGALMYLPWAVFAWAYYGTPIPHTIQAKVSHYPPGELTAAWLLYPWRLLVGHTAVHDVFMPAYWFFGGWPAFLGWVSRVLAVGAALAWVVPGVRAPGRMASAAFFLGGLYVEYIPRSPWYYPGWQVLAYLAWAYLLDAAWQRAVLRPAVRIGVATAIAVQAAVFACVAVQMRTQQALIEDAQRTKIGTWLKTHAAAGDRVYLEPLGYIGFFSGLKMLDYPGLASREVVAARRSGAKPHAALIRALMPQWLVLRPDQIAGIRAADPALLERDYGVAEVFDVRPAVAAVGLLPGRGYLEFDAFFAVFAKSRFDSNVLP